MATSYPGAGATVWLVTSTTSLAVVVVFSCVGASSALAQTQPRGTVVDPVPCADDPTQTYALYLPSSYAPERTWSLLLAFHPAARGRFMAEKYQVGADVSRRFSIDPTRVYLTGMSGGARVALGIALANTSIAGVIASSAGYPDSQPRDKVGFAVFGTAGTEDFRSARCSSSRRSWPTTAAVPSR